MGDVDERSGVVADVLDEQLFFCSIAMPKEAWSKVPRSH